MRKSCKTLRDEEPNNLVKEFVIASYSYTKREFSTVKNGKSFNSRAMAVTPSVLHDFM